MSAKGDIRKPAVAGMFYPDDPAQLRADVDALLADAAACGVHPPPKAIIVPHAGYMYSGPVAATAYASLRGVSKQVTRVVLLGPAHRVYVDGIAVTSARAYETPLGEIPVDQDAVRSLLDLPQVRIFDAAHVPEHSLEVQLPFLQRVLGRFSLVPLVVGEASAGEIGEVIDRLWGDDETLIVVSSDLSHYLPYEAARAADTKTAQLVTEMRYAELESDQACGVYPVTGLLAVAPKYGLRAELVDLRNSGDTAGAKNKVVGYGSFLFR